MLAEGSGYSSPPDAKPDVDQVCEVIDRLELHRRCIEEAMADAYWELMAMLGCGQEGAGREAPRPF
jgi:hypothetical protein